jgi:hypothetical protein
MKGGAVMFEPVENPFNVMARGFINNEDGTFTLTTEKQGDGAMTGRYRAAVRGRLMRRGYGSIPEAPNPAGGPQIHPRFESFKTSGLEFTVEPRTNTFVITVEKPPSPRS